MEGKAPFDSDCLVLRAPFRPFLAPFEGLLLTPFDADSIFERLVAVETAVLAVNEPFSDDRFESITDEDDAADAEGEGEEGEEANDEEGVKKDLLCQRDLGS